MNIENLNANELIAEMASQMQPEINRETALIGIASGGLLIVNELLSRFPDILYAGKVDVGLHRDDFGIRGMGKSQAGTEITFDIEDKHIIIVDDVIGTGRTARAAMNELFDFGRPKSIKLAVLLDRGGRELPISPDYIGTFLEVGSKQEIVVVDDRSHGLSIQIKSSVG
jgi:pyrimidine operon attenuation protein/uracil phosphoribosyltransferase